MIDTMAKTPAMGRGLPKRDWTQITLLGDDYKPFLEKETARIEGILKELGLA